MEKLLLGCPLLESLTLVGCTLKMNNISSRTLKQLTLSDCVFVSTLVPKVFTISAPNVENLRLEGYMGRGNRIIFNVMFNVHEAWLCLEFAETGNEKVGYNSEHLSDLSGVKGLYLSCDILMEMLKGEVPKLPTFNNLKFLVVDRCCVNCNFGLVSSLLKHCPGNIISPSLGFSL